MLFSSNENNQALAARTEHPCICKLQKEREYGLGFVQKEKNEREKREMEKKEKKRKREEVRKMPVFTRYIGYQLTLKLIKRLKKP